MVSKEEFDAAATEAKAGGCLETNGSNAQRSTTYPPEAGCSPDVCYSVCPVVENLQTVVRNPRTECGRSSVQRPQSGCSQWPSCEGFKKATNEEQVTLYGWFKQANIGDVNIREHNPFHPLPIPCYFHVCSSKDRHWMQIQFRERVDRPGRSMRRVCTSAL
jgi:hypothetical protein